MIKIISICLVVLASAHALLTPKCTVDPIENRWPHMHKICSDHEVKMRKFEEYDHDTIERALKMDKDMLAFIEDAARIYEPVLPYDGTDMTDICQIPQNPFEPQLVECGKICPGKIRNLTTVWYESEPGKKTMCKVIRPWQQVVYYSQCENKYPYVDGMDNSFQCVPEDIIRRRIAVYCPDIAPQCRKMDIDLPQHCAASQFHCIRKKVSRKSQIDDLFAMFG